MHNSGHTLVTLAWVMFDQEAPWHLSSIPGDGAPVIFGHPLSAAQRAAVEKGIVVSAVMRYPRAANQELPDQASPEGMRYWLRKDEGFQVAKLGELNFAAEASGDDSPACCVLTLSVPTVSWPLDVTEFEDFSKLVRPGEDISRFKDSFSSALDVNGVVAIDQVGFHFCLDGDEPGIGYAAQAKDMLATFEPAIIYVGTKELQAELLALGYQSIVHGYYEDGGLAVVLRVPAGATLFPRVA